IFFFSSRRRHTRSKRDWSSDVCSSDLSVASGRASFLVTRTGYTGEAGFELFPASAEGSWVWESLLKSGADLGIKPIGLGARDTRSEERRVGKGGGAGRGGKEGRAVEKQ